MVEKIRGGETGEARVRVIGPGCGRVEDLAKSQGPAVMAGIGAVAPLRKEADLHMS